MIRVFDITRYNEDALFDLLLEYTERYTKSLRGARLSEPELKGYRSIIDRIADELWRRKSRNIKQTG